MYKSSKKKHSSKKNTHLHSSPISSSLPDPSTLLAHLLPNTSGSSTDSMGTHTTVSHNTMVSDPPINSHVSLSVSCSSSEQTSPTYSSVSSLLPSKRSKKTAMSETLDSETTQEIDALLGNLKYIPLNKLFTSYIPRIDVLRGLQSLLHHQNTQVHEAEVSSKSSLFQLACINQETSRIYTKWTLTNWIPAIKPLS